MQLVYFADWLCQKTCGQWWWHVLDWYPCLLLCNTLALKTMASLTYRKCFVFFFRINIFDSLAWGIDFRHAFRSLATAHVESVIQERYVDAHTKSVLMVIHCSIS